MFRQLLTAQQPFSSQHTHDDLYFPNLNQLVKVETACAQKNVGFVPLVRMSGRDERIEVSLDILEEFKDQRIVFVTRVGGEAIDGQWLIEISQAPVHVDNGCNYFLLNAYCSGEKAGQYSTTTNTKPHLSKQSYHTNSKTPTHPTSKTPHHPNKPPSLSPRQLFTNLCYLLSSTLYLPSTHLADFLSTITTSPSTHHYPHINHLQVYQTQGSTTPKKQDHYRVSTTAADTKAYHHDSVESDIFQGEFSFVVGGSGKGSGVGGSWERGGKGRRQEGRRVVDNSDRRDKLFSRTVYIEQQQTQSKLTQHILHSICSPHHTPSPSPTPLTYPSIQHLLTTLSSTRHLLSLPQFHTVNHHHHTTHLLSTILTNHSLQMQEEFNSIEQKSIDQIKAILKHLFDKAVLEFYDGEMGEGDQREIKETMGRLVGEMEEAEGVLLQNVNKAKKQAFERRLSYYDDQHYRQKALAENETRFGLILGDRVSLQQQIGFNLYKETIKHKISSIFSQLVTEDTVTKKSASFFKSRKGKVMSRSELSTNIDKRIEILLGQKRNLQQSLHFEERLQENLMECFNGKRVVGQKRNQIQTISEGSEDE